MINKEWIMNNWEQDWDNEGAYFKIRENGDMIMIVFNQEQTQRELEVAK